MLWNKPLHSPYNTAAHWAAKYSSQVWLLKKTTVMKTGKILLIIGLITVAVGAVLSTQDIEPYADYTLVAGAVLVVLSGSFRMRGK